MAPIFLDSSLFFSFPWVYFSYRFLCSSLPQTAHPYAWSDLHAKCQPGSSVLSSLDYPLVVCTLLLFHHLKLNTSLRPNVTFTTANWGNQFPLLVSSTWNYISLLLIFLSSPSQVIHQVLLGFCFSQKCLYPSFGLVVTCPPKVHVP